MGEHGGLQYLDDFVEEMKDYLQECYEERGDAWLNTAQETQIVPLEGFITNQFIKNSVTGKPINWVGIAVESFLGKIRDDNPDKFRID